MKSKNKIIFSAIGMFLLIWIVGGIVVDIFFAIIGIGSLSYLSGTIGFIGGIWYAIRLYKNEIEDINNNDQKKEEKSEIFYCNKCGYKLENNSIFCSKCGAKI